MIRCAFAHNPANPTWEVRGKYEGIPEPELTDIGLKIDIFSLNGRPLSDSQFNGYNQLLKLMEHCLEVIRRNDR
jgi:hypothetical protein